MIKIQVNEFGIIDSLKLLAMPPEQRDRLVWRAANMVKKKSAANVRGQKTPEGDAWPARKRGKRKMLMGMPKLMYIDDKQHGVAIIKLKKGRMDVHGALVGKVHSDGHVFQRTTEQASAFKQPDPSAPASRRQARKLRELGFKRRGKKAGHYVSASIKWITENLSYNQAGLLIKKLSGKKPKRSWVIKLPARPFLGVTARERQEIFAEALRGINYGWDVKKQQMRKR